MAAGEMQDGALGIHSTQKSESVDAMSIDDSRGNFPTLPTALVAAADVSFRSFLEYIIRNGGFLVAGASTARELNELLRQHSPDILLIESRLADFETRKACAQLRLDRRTRAIAIIVLASGSEEESQDEMIGSEADHYLNRPFSPEKLMATLSTVWQDRALTLGARDLLTYLDLELDLASYRVRRNGRTIHLAPTEFRLLHHLMKNPQRVYSRDELQSAAWPRAVHLGPRTIDVHIGRLRAALNETGGQHLIRTVRSVGYALSD